MYVSKSSNVLFNASNYKLKNISRMQLQKQSCLKNLNTRMVRDDHSLHDMLIPGGMSTKEAFIYKLTGKYPKSVTERWKQIWGADIKNVSTDDEVVHVHKSVLQDTGYFSNLEYNNEHENFDNIIEHTKQTGNIIKNGFKNFFEDIANKIDDIL